MKKFSWIPGPLGERGPGLQLINVLIPFHFQRIATYGVAVRRCDFLESFFVSFMQQAAKKLCNQAGKAASVNG